MSLSLLDLLSCSLAVVVILLVIALNTGKGSQDATDQAIVVEVLIYGSNSLENDLFELTTPDTLEQLYLRNTGLVYKLQSDLGLLDSLQIKASIMLDLPIPDTTIEGTTYRQCLRMSFNIPPPQRVAISRPHWPVNLTISRVR